MKRKFSQRVGNFLEGKGFYIVLLLCLAVIAVTGFYLLRSFGVFTQEEPAAVSGQAQVVISPTEEETGVEALTPEVSAALATEAPTASPEVSESTMPVETPAQEAAVVEESPSEPVSAEITTWPIEGTVVTAFSADALVQDPTMGDWRVHQGLDLAAETGTSVQAVGDGTVTAVYEDVLLGTVVEVDHGAGLVSIYGSLAPEVSVAAGDTVSAGSVLGTVGDSAGESAVETHLHFAMSQDGELVNPADYLP